MPSPQDVPKFGFFLSHLIQKAEHDDGQAIFTGLMANIVGHMSDEYWAKLKADATLPCEQPGCQCHIIQGKLFDALEGLREEWKRICNEKDAGNWGKDPQAGEQQFPA